MGILLAGKSWGLLPTQLHSSQWAASCASCGKLASNVCRDFDSKEATFKEEPTKEFSLTGHELFKPYVSQPCDAAADNVDTQVCSAYMEESSDSLQQEMYERTGWLPVIPEESEGEEGIAENEASHQRLQLADDVDSHVLKSRNHSESLDSSLTQQDVLEKQSKEAILEISRNASSVTTGLVYEHGRENLKIPDNEINCEPTTIASRRSRIENIFMLCGNRRELISTQTSAGASDSMKLVTSSPTQIVSASLITSKDPVSPRWNRSSETRPVPLKPRELSTENTPPHGRSSLLTSFILKSQSSKSPRKLSFDGLSLSPKALNGIQQHADRDVDSCEVFVKWETSKDSCGKLIKIVSMKECATLAMLRQELESILASEEKHDFQFLMLGDPSGGPVKRDNEDHLTVGSLPDCHKKQGSKLACLRPHFRHGMLSPLRPVENQISRSSSILATVRPTDGSLNHLKSPKGTLTCQIIEGALTPHSADMAKQRLSFSASPHAKGLRL